jgi:hypothetical protein
VRDLDVVTHEHAANDAPQRPAPHGLNVPS